MNVIVLSTISVTKMVSFLGRSFRLLLLLIFAFTLSAHADDSLLNKIKNGGASISPAQVRVVEEELSKLPLSKWDNLLEAYLGDRNFGYVQGKSFIAILSSDQARFESLLDKLISRVDIQNEQTTTRFLDAFGATVLRFPHLNSGSHATRLQELTDQALKKRWGGYNEVLATQIYLDPNRTEFALDTKDKYFPLKASLWVENAKTLGKPLAQSVRAKLPAVIDRLDKKDPNTLSNWETLNSIDRLLEHGHFTDPESHQKLKEILLELAGARSSASAFSLSAPSAEVAVKTLSRVRSDKDEIVRRLLDIYFERPVEQDFGSYSNTLLEALKELGGNDLALRYVQHSKFRNSKDLDTSKRIIKILGGFAPNSDLLRGYLDFSVKEDGKFDVQDGHVRVSAAEEILLHGEPQTRQAAVETVRKYLKEGPILFDYRDYKSEKDIETSYKGLEELGLDTKDFIQSDKKKFREKHISPPGYAETQEEASRIAGNAGLTELLPELVEVLDRNSPLTKFEPTQEAIKTLFKKAPPSNKLRARLNQLLRKSIGENYNSIYASADILASLQDPEAYSFFKEHAADTKTDLAFYERNRYQAATKALSQYKREENVEGFVDRYFSGKGSDKKAAMDWMNGEDARPFEKQVRAHLKQRLVDTAKTGDKCDLLCGLNVEAKPWFVDAASNETITKAAEETLKAFFIIQASPYCPNFAAKEAKLLEALQAKLEAAPDDVQRIVPGALRAQMETSAYHSNYFLQYNISLIRTLLERGMDSPKGHRLGNWFASQLVAGTENANRLKTAAQGGSNYNYYAIGSSVAITTPDQNSDKAYQILRDALDSHSPGRSRYSTNESLDDARGSAGRNVSIGFAQFLKNSGEEQRESMFSHLEGFVEFSPDLILSHFSGEPSFDELLKTLKWHSGRSGMAPYYLLPNLAYATQAVSFLKAGENKV